MKITRKWRRAWQRGKLSFLRRNKKKKSQKKVSAPIKQQRPQRTTQASWRGAAVAASLLAAVSLGSPQAQAMPQDGQIVAGSGTIAQSANTMTINQSTGKMAINWQQFNIAANEKVQFIQPGSQAVALNRVLGSDPSAIYGQLTANGQVFLLNPSGVLFAPGARVDVGGLVASTWNMTDKNFLEGQYNFQGGSGSIVNQGMITANGGYVVLAGAKVTNEGTIIADNGTAALVAGSGMTLDLNGAGRIGLSVDTAAVNAAAENKGLLQADGGQVLLTARTADALAGTVLNNSGIVRARSISSQNGSIRLDGGASGTVQVSGTLDASGTAQGQTGGSIKVLGSTVSVANATIDASGDKGGGTVLVGGNYQGKGPEPNAITTTVASDAIIKADALTAGDGGTVIVWADNVTRAHGTITAQGGTQGGNGGLVETSGHLLDVDGIRVSTAAQQGMAGNWLLDPWNVDIVSDSTATSGTPAANSYNPTATSAIRASAISSALAANNVTITTGSSGTDAGVITVSSPITKSIGLVTTTLTLQAADNVTVNAPITVSNPATTGKLNVNLYADNDNGVQDGVGIVLLNNSISTNGGSVSFGNGMSKGSGVYVGGSSPISIDTRINSNTTGGGSIAINGEMLIGNTNGLNISTGGGSVGFGGLVNSANSYTYVPVAAGSNTWDSAVTAAKGSTGGGSAVGDTYLATITSRLENSIAAGVANYQEAWLGAKRGGNGYAANNNDGTVLQNTWYWVTGPEGLMNSGRGQAFYNSASSSGSAVNGSYINWSPGEPNNYGQTAYGTPYGEYAMQFVGKQGLWNDLHPLHTQPLGYIKETNLAASPLTVNAAGGTVDFFAAIGSQKAIGNLNITASSLNVAGSITSEGSQTYNANVKIAASDLSLLTKGPAASGYDILFNNGITKTGAGDATLTVKAHRDVYVQSDITAAGGKLNILLEADSENTGPSTTHNGAGFIQVNNNIATNGGSLQLGSGATITLSGTTTQVGGDLYVAGTGAQTISTGGGAVTINGETIIANTSGLTIDTGGGAAAFNGVVNSGNRYDYVPVASGTWDSAVTGAKGSTGGGSAVGDTYLATITSRLENAIASRAAGYKTAWLGAKRGGNGYAANNADGTKIEDFWYWVTGPEGLMNNGRGKDFYKQTFFYYNGAPNQAVTGSPVNGMYNNWSTSEPNNWYNATIKGEYVMQFTGNQGLWNDLNPVDSNSVAGYIKETNLAASPLTVNAGAGNVTFNSSVGGSKAVSSLALTGSAVSAGNITLANSGALSVTNSGTSGISGVIGGSAATLSKAGAGTLNLSGANTYTGATDITAGALVIQSNTPTTASSTFKGAGTLTIEPVSAGFTNSFSNGDWTFDSTLGGLTIGKSGNTADLTLSSAVSIAGPISLYGKNIAINAALTATGTNTITLKGSGTVTDGASGYLVADKLALLGGSVTLDNSSNNIGTLAASGVGSLTYVDSNALTVGTVGSVDGINTTGAVSVSTLTGDLTVAKDVTTTNTTTSAVALHAGKSTTVGTASGGNIIVSGSPQITVGSGGRATLYTGSVSDSTGLTSFIGSGSGKFRYNANETTNFATGGWTNLSSGVYAVYRERPSVTMTVDGKTITYGDSLTLTGTPSGLVNGDMASYDIISPAYSSSNNIKAGSYTIANSNLAALGYNVTSNTSGTLTVNRKDLTVSGLTSANKVYDGTTTAAVNGTAALQPAITGDTVSLAGTAAGSFNDKNVADATTVSFTGLSLTGADAGNYNLTPHASGAYTISRKALTVTANDDAKFVTRPDANGYAGVSYSGFVNGETDAVLGGTPVISRSTSGPDGNTSGSNELAGTYTGALTPSGLSAANYTITYAAGKYTIVPAGTLLIKIGNTSAVYGDNVALTPTSVQYLNGSDVLTTLTQTSHSGSTYTYSDEAGGSATFTLTTGGTNSSSGHLIVGNYSTSGTNFSKVGTNFSGSPVFNTGSLTVTQKGLTAAASNVSKTYDGTTAMAGVSLGSSDIISGDAVTVSGTGAFASKNAGTNLSYTISGVSLSGTDAGNYYLTGGGSLSGSNGVITQKNITITADAGLNKIYGNSDPTLTYGGSVSLASGDSYVGTLSRTAGENAGSYAINQGTLNIMDGNNGNNYSIVYVSKDLIINKRPITAAASNVSKTYDGTTAMTGVSLDLPDKLSGDVVTVSGKGAFASKNVGTNLSYTISEMSLSGADAGNYSLTGGDSWSGSNGEITAKNLSVTYTGVNKVYDGNTTASVLTSDNRVNGDVLTISRTANFADKNVGNGKGVDVTGVSLGGADAGNYVLTSTTGSTTADITRLSSVTWIGGSTGNWFDPANWAGGAVPDKSNVANVVIPSGKTVTFDATTIVAPAESGSVSVDGIGNAGSLNMTDGTLNVGAGGIQLANLNQAGGTLTNSGATTVTTLTQSGGSFTATGAVITNSFSQTGGTMTTSGNFTVNESYSQGTSGTVTVGGNTAITDTSGGVTVGNLTTTGNLNVISTGGDIMQSSGTAITTTGSTTLNASNGSIPANITLDGTNNDFNSIGVTGKNVNITDKNGVDLNTSTISGTLGVTAGGDITQNGPLTVTGATTIDAGANNVTLNNANNDFSSIGVTGKNVSLNDKNGVALDTSTISGTLGVTAGGDVTQNGPLTVTGATTIDAGANNVTLNNANNDFSSIGVTGKNVSLNDKNGVALNTSIISGTLGVTAGGDVTQNGPLTVTGATTIDAGANNVTLNNANNDFSSIGVTGKNVSLNDKNGVALNTSSISGTLGVKAGGDVTQTGPLTVTGATTIDAGANNVTLNNANNDFSSIGVTGKNVSLNDKNGVALDASTITGTLGVTAGGDITQNGSLTVTGATTIDAGANNVTLNNANNDFSSIGVKGKDVTITDKNEVALNTSTVTGTLGVKAGGDVTQTGPLTVTGATTIDAGANNVTLNNANNDFSSIGVTGKNVSLNDKNGVALDTSNISGTLGITAGGDITQNGPLTVTGATTIDAGANNVTLNNANNDFSSIGVTGKNVSLNDKNGVALDTSNISGTLGITAGGDITQNGPLTVTGATTIDAGANNVTLNNANNDFSSIGVTGKNVSLNDKNGVALNTSIISGTLGVTAGGDVTQNGSLTVTGATTIDAGANNVTLNNANNDFSSIGVTGKNVSLNDKNGVALDTSNISGTLGVTAGGDVTQNGPLTVTGATTIDAGANNVTLNDANNDFSSIGVTGKNVSITDKNGVALNTSTISGTLGVTVGGDVTQNGPLTVTGATTIDAGANNVTLNDANNDFSSIGVTGKNVSLNDKNRVALNTSTISGTLGVTAGGDVTQTGPLTVAGETSISAVGGITLTNADNDFGGAVSATNSAPGNVALVDRNNLTLKDVTTGGGSLSAKAAGTGSILHVISTVNAGGGNIDLSADNVDISRATAVQTSGITTLRSKSIDQATGVGDKVYRDTQEIEQSQDQTSDMSVKTATGSGDTAASGTDLLSVNGGGMKLPGSQEGINAEAVEQTEQRPNNSQTSLTQEDVDEKSKKSSNSVVPVTTVETAETNTDQ